MTSTPAPSPALTAFHEDVLLAILSYVADVPFEVAENPSAVPVGHSTLTHTLPLVSKQFRRLTGNHDLFWKHALLRLVRKEPSLWDDGLQCVTFDANCDALRSELIERNRSQTARRRDKRAKYVPSNQAPLPPVESNSPAIMSPTSKPPEGAIPTLAPEEELLQQASAAVLARPPVRHAATTAGTGTHQRIFRAVAQNHLRYQAPVFWMPSALRLGSPYGLHFFEPRYRLLIAEVMAPQPAGARRGEPVAALVPGLLPLPPGLRGTGTDVAAIRNLVGRHTSLLERHYLPTFIHAHQALHEHTPASIVQVLRCDIQPDGSADVLLNPVAYIWLEKIWERPGTGGLVEARGIRMGKEASESYELWCGMRRYGRGDGRGRDQMLPIP